MVLHGRQRREGKVKAEMSRLWPPSLNTHCLTGVCDLCVAFVLECKVSQDSAVEENEEQLEIPCAVWHGQKIKEWQGSLSHVKLSVLHSHAQQIVMLIKMRLLPGSYGSHLHQCLFQTTCLSSVHI